jgi:hypothetical protein
MAAFDPFLPLRAIAANLLSPQFRGEALEVLWVIGID